jgi:hypothetical protein
MIDIKFMFITFKFSIVIKTPCLGNQTRRHLELVWDYVLEIGGATRILFKRKFNVFNSFIESNNLSGKEYSTFII